MKFSLKEAFFRGMTGLGAVGLVGGIATGQPELAVISAVAAVANAIFAERAHREVSPQNGAEPPKPDGPG